MKDRIAGIVADPRLWAYIVTSGLTWAQVTATAKQTELIVAGITALLLFVVHKFVKGPE